MATSQLYHDAAGGNQKTWTFSAWVKRCGLGAVSYLYSQGSAGNNYIAIYFGSADDFRVYNEASSSQTLYFRTNRLFRDLSAWYHVVVRCDTTQATEADRFKIWINGVQETSFSSASYPAQNSDTNMNAATRERIGVYHPGGSSPNYYWNGYMSHVSMVDGQALAPTVFGETDSTSGIWKFKGPSGVTWGTNGFHLKFENSGALGTDSSGQSNTFSVSGNLKQALDTPSNVHATLNPLINIGTDTTYSEGNNTASSDTANYRVSPSTLAVSSGKWYMEFKAVSGGFGSIDACVGVLPTDTVFSTSSNNLNAYTNGSSYGSHGQVKQSGSGTLYTGSTYADGDIVGVALDMDNNKLYFHKNGTYQNSGVPTSGSTGTGAVSIASGKEYYFACSTIASGGTKVFSANFGNGYFGTTAISSAGSNGNGSLFEYDVPSGYYALNTKNINTYG